MRAEEIVERIGTGVRNALDTNNLFLGVEAEIFENADIHPEYVTTVKVGEALIDAKHVVSLETQMRQLRALARRMAKLKTIKQKGKSSSIDAALTPYVFGKSDRQRLDILVRGADGEWPPILMAEAKLGARNLPGILFDVDRIIRLFDMLKAVDLNSDVTYGAVVFHLMEEKTPDQKGNVVSTSSNRAKHLLNGIRAHLKDSLQSRSWLHSKADLLKSAKLNKPMNGYVETHDDGTNEQVFAKHGFSFVPGLVLLGSASDVDTVAF